MAILTGILPCIITYVVAAIIIPKETLGLVTAENKHYHDNKVKCMHLKGVSMAKSERRAIDKVFILLGIAATAMLLVAGSMALYGYRFATSNVRNELAAQKIYFPEAGSANFSAEVYPDLQQYAGQIVDDGLKAKAYANGYIGRHLDKIAGGKTYAEVSAEAQKDPDNEKLQQQKQSLFQGETLRGLLLSSGYVNWTFGEIAGIAALVSFIGAGIMTVLVLLGIMHLKKR